MRETVGRAKGGVGDPRQTCGRPSVSGEGGVGDPRPTCGKPSVSGEGGVGDPRPTCGRPSVSGEGGVGDPRPTRETPRGAARSMKQFLKRVTIALCSGYIIVYYGEIVFWATPEHENFHAGGFIAVWLAYSIFAYPFLCVTSLFNVRDPWAVFLAGAFYGWFEEGIVVQTMYGPPDGWFPASISFTGLAWHALLDVWIGWYLVRKVLSQNKYLKTAALAGAIGLFYGFWGIWWWNQPPPPMKDMLETGQKGVMLILFALFAFGTTAALVFAHWIYNRVRLAEFKPSKVELWIISVVTLLYYALITVPAAPKAIWVLPPLLGVTLWALAKNGRTETRPNVIVAYPEDVKILNYLLLFLIPLVATAVYYVALAADARLATNRVVYYVTTPLGALLWLMSVITCVRPKMMPATTLGTESAPTVIRDT